MKALSIRQPWAWAVLHAGKRLENRDWSGCALRGPILLHASLGVGSRDDFDYAMSEILLEIIDKPGMARFNAEPIAQMRRDLRGRKGEALWSPTPSLQLGGIVGRARVDGVIHREADFTAYAANVPDGEEQRVWWAGGFALVLADVEALPFTPWKGALGFFDVDERALEEHRKIVRGALGDG